MYKHILTQHTLLDVAVLLLYLYGILLLARKFREIHPRYLRFFLLIGVEHLFFTFSYYYYSLGNVADSVGYYRTVYFLTDSWKDVFGQGTLFIYFTLYPLIKVLHLTYLSCFLVYSFIGLLGFYYLLKMAIHINNNHWSNWYYILLLPNLHFWTNALGKDSLIFYGIAGITYCLYFKKKWISFLFPVLVVGFVRIHVLFFILIALAINYFILSKKFRTGQRILMAAVFILSIYLLFPFFAQRVGLSEENSLEERIEQMQNVNQAGTTSVNMADSNLLVRWNSYFFRPFFYDAHNMLAMVASMENVAWIIMFIFILLYTKRNWFYLKQNPFFIFCLLAIFIVSFPSVLILTNLGIALRQKMMVFPFVFVFLIALNKYYQLEKKRKYSAIYYSY